jgi:hypothetical protein
MADFRLFERPPSLSGIVEEAPRWRKARQLSGGVCVGAATICAGLFSTE